MLIKPAATYREIYDAFRWKVPARFNMAAACCDRWAADPARVALIHEQPDGQVRRYTFAELQRLSNRCANMLVGLGLVRGDRVLLLLGQRPETAILHLGAWRAGMISVLCSVLFGADAVGYRVQTSGAKVVITDEANLATALEAAGDARVLCIDGAHDGAGDFWALLRQGAETFTTVDTASDDPAFICFTSGTTGPPKGALHAHRTLLGHLPCMEMQQNFFPQRGDLVWSAADWAWIAGLMDVLMPSWFHGVPVLAFRSIGFDPEQAFHMMAKHEVRNALLVPTMIRLMKQVPDPLARFDLHLRSLVSGGEAVGAEIIEWTQETLNVRINEVFGQTECNLVLGHNATLMQPKPGSLGQPIPGHIGAVVDDNGNELPRGEVGHIAFKRPDPVMLLEYWNNPQATKDKFVGDWLLTGDLGQRDEDGYLWYHGRADDVITSAGYRIGPGEIEDALLRHPAVRLAAVIGVPDPLRTESIKAFLVLAEGQPPSEALEREIREFVRTRLAPTNTRARSSSSTTCRRRPQARSCGASYANANGRKRDRLPDPRPRTTKEKDPCPFPLSIYRAPGGLRQDPGHGAESLAGEKNSRKRGGEMRVAGHAVAIVGGGPTGLMLGGELALAGIDVAIVERRASQDLIGSRAGGLHSRTIEVLDQRGIADRFLSQGQVAQVAQFCGTPLDISDFPTRHPYGLGLWQNHIERTLAGWVDELGVPIHRGREVTGVAQDDTGVDVRLSGGRSLRAEYLVGCDGGRSLVRKAAGIDFPGWDPTTSCLIAEVEMAPEAGEAPDWGVVRRDALGVHGLNRLEDGETVRIVVTEQHLGPTSEPTLRDLSEALIAVYGTDYGIHSPTWISRFTDMTRQAAAYRDRRILLAGDAAHVHDPVGGQGLNTGVQDAVNLGWKLAQVVKKTSPESLLDTYHSERHPVAARVLRNTMAQVALRRLDDRRKALSDSISELLGMEDPRKRFAGMMSGLDIHYDLGEGHPLLGRRMPDLDLLTANGPLRVFTLLHDARPVLLNLREATGFDITGWEDRVQLINAKYVGKWELPVLGAVTAPAAVLIRPDGYVAWVGELTDLGLPGALTAWFGQPNAA